MTDSREAGLVQIAVKEGQYWDLRSLMVRRKLNKFHEVMSYLLSCEDHLLYLDGGRKPMKVEEEKPYLMSHI